MMDGLLEKCGIPVFPSNAPSCDIATALEDVHIDKLKTLRSNLFVNGKELNLTDSRDVLVNRKTCVTHPLRKKLAEDIVRLDRCIKSMEKFPRTLLHSGKRNLEELEHTRTLNDPDLAVNTPEGFSQQETASASTLNTTRCTEINQQHSMPSSLAHPTSTPLDSSSGHSAVPGTIAALMRDLNHLHNEVESLKSSIQLVKTGLTQEGSPIYSALSEKITSLKIQVKQIKGADTTKGEEDTNISLLNPNPATIPLSNLPKQQSNIHRITQVSLSLHGTVEI